MEGARAVESEIMAFFVAIHLNAWQGGQSSAASRKSWQRLSEWCCTSHAG